MDDKDFSARVLSVIKNNLFEIKKLFFNLDDCVPKTDLDNLQENLSAAQSSIKNLQTQKTRLENEVDNKSSEISDLLRQTSDMREKIDSQQEELRRRKEKISQLLDALEEKKSQLAEKTSLLERFTENYSDLERAYNAYKNLSDKTKFALEGIFGVENSPTSFLAGALQDGHLESLFDYIATAINNGADNSEVEILREIFDFAFDAVNGGRQEKIFARLEISEGDDFDASTMRKTSDSSQSGTVKNILLVGFKYIRTDKIVKPSLVFIY